MARPKTKEELIYLSNFNYQKLITYINNFSKEAQQKEFPEGTLNRNIKDVLSHLHHWHLMLLDWYTIGMSGKKPVMPAKGYSWKTTPDLNVEIWKTYKNTTLEDAKKAINDSFEQIQNIIHKHPDIELFEKKRYKWTGSTSLASYLISATSSHYDWALKLIKKAQKNCQM